MAVRKINKSNIKGGVVKKSGVVKKWSTNLATKKAAVKAASRRPVVSRVSLSSKPTKSNKIKHVTEVRRSNRIKGIKPEFGFGALDSHAKQRRERLFLEGIVLRTAGQAKNDEEPEAAGPDWKCGFCGHSNAHDESRCCGVVMSEGNEVVCNHGRPAPATFMGWAGTPFFALQQEQWTCGVCNVKNALNAASCAACKAARP